MKMIFREIIKPNWFKILIFLILPFLNFQPICFAACKRSFFHPYFGPVFLIIINGLFPESPVGYFVVKTSLFYVVSFLELIALYIFSGFIVSYYKPYRDTIKAFLKPNLKKLILFFILFFLAIIPGLYCLDGCEFIFFPLTLSIFLSPMFSIVFFLIRFLMLLPIFEFTLSPLILGDIEPPTFAEWTVNYYSIFLTYILSCFLLNLYQRLKSKQTLI